MEVNSDTIIMWAKDSLQSYCCEWDGCNVKCNSWNNYFKHVSRIHCRLQKNNAHPLLLCRWRTPPTYGYGKICSFSFESSVSGTRLLQDHVKQVHFSKIQIQCPYEGCKKQFTRHPRLAEHYEDYHEPPSQEMMSRHRTAPMVRQPQSLHPLPDQPLSSFQIYESEQSSRVRPQEFNPSSSQNPSLPEFEKKQKRALLKERKLDSHDSDLSEDDCSVIFEDLDLSDNVEVGIEAEKNGETVISTKDNIVIRSNKETNLAANAAIALLPFPPPGGYPPRVAPASFGFAFMEQEYKKLLKEEDSKRK